MNEDNALLEKEIRQLIELKTENKNLDYKEKLNWDKCSNEERVGVVKDILAMANTQDGGRIIFGVRDTDYELIGLSEEDFKSFDQTKVNDFLHIYTDPKFAVQVYKNKIDNKYVVAIFVPEFEELPVVCKKDANSSRDSSKLILRKGQIYIRTDKATSENIPSSQEMRELLGRALTKKGDELLHLIERLIKGKPLRPTEDTKEKYDEEIKEADKFLSEKIGDELEKYGYWEIYTYPQDYNQKRIMEKKKFKELIEKSEVAFRGWNFPHTEKEEKFAYFNRGIQSYTIWGRHREGYRLYQSGLFAWKRALWEDIEGYNDKGKPVLSFVSAIWSILEFFTFFKRYYSEISPQDDLYIEIVLNNIQNRKLMPLDPGVFISESYISNEKKAIVVDKIKIIDLSTSYKEIANRFTRDIFLIFNCEISEQIIDEWQTKLIEKKY